MDTLAKRYGWHLSEISERMYWEEVYEMYELACNLNVLEKGENMKFHYMLNTTKEGASKWKDLPIPFPHRNWKPVPKQNRLPRAFEKNAKREKMTTEREGRYAYVQKRLEEHRKKVEEQNMEYYSSYYNN